MMLTPDAGVLKPTPLVRDPAGPGTDARTTRFVLLSQALMVAGSVGCAWLEAGQTSVYVITVASFILYIVYALYGKSVIFQKLMLFGIVAGLLELAADHFSVALVGALVYPEGYSLWSSPLYMPLSWAIALTQLGYLSLLATNRLGLLKASLLMAILGGFYIPLYEHLALAAGWWFYQNCSMIWHTPYYIILFEIMVAGSLPLLVMWMHRRETLKAAWAGLAEGIWLMVSAVVAYYVFYFTLTELVTEGAFCSAFPALSPYINLCEFSMADVGLIVVGTLLWNAAYIIIIRDGFRNKFIEIPVPAVASNLAWEFVWGFMVVTSLGNGFVWGLRGWFFLDLLIVYGIICYGSKQLSIPELKKNFSLMFFLTVLLWIPAFYLFVQDKYDTSMGATSAYMITVIMELLYILFYLSAGENQKYYAPSVAWLRFAGNGFMSVFVFMHYPQMQLLQYMCLIVLVLDIIYLVLLHRKKVLRA